MKHYNATIGLMLLALVGCATQQGSSDEATSSRNQALSKESKAAPQVQEMGPAPLAVTMPAGAEGVPSLRPDGNPKRVDGSTAGEVVGASANTLPAQAAADGYASPAEAASGALPLLSALANSPQAAQARGFDSPSEVQSANVEEGIPVSYVRLDQLARYKSGQDTSSLLIDKGQLFYPLSVDGDPRSSVRVRKRGDGKWEAVELGNKELARSAFTQGKHVKTTRAVQGRLTMVEIPTVHAFLLSHIENGKHVFTPLYDIPGTLLKAGETLGADETLQALAALAAQVDPTKPN